MVLGQTEFKAVRKRDASLDPFNREKIVDAIYSAAETVGGTDRKKAEKVADRSISLLLDKRLKIPSVDDITNANIQALIEEGYDGTAKAYEVYSNKRKRVREKLQIAGRSESSNTTDQFLMVSSFTDEMAHPWDKEKIVESLVKDADLDLQKARKIAKVVENNIVLSEFSMITTNLIRELASVEMLRLGLHENANKYSNLILPKSDLEAMLFEKSSENSNIKANNPGAVEFSVWGRVSKQYALDDVFSKEVSRGNNLGINHLHDMDLIERVYCSAHSIEAWKKDGLRLDNLQTSSKPPSHTETLTAHINTRLASLQAYYAGALGLYALNVFYASLIEADLRELGSKKIYTKLEELQTLKERASSNKDLEMILSEEESKLKFLLNDPISALTENEIDGTIYQEAQKIIFSLSQNAFSRGGQTLFLDANIHSGTPKFLENVLVVGPKGKYILEKDGRRVYIDERKLDETTPTGYRLSEYFDASTGRVVARDKFDIWEDPVTKKKVPLMSREEFLEEDEELLTYGIYNEDRGYHLVGRFAKSLFRVWKEGDADGNLFSFPKCNFHVDNETLTNPKQREVYESACDLSSANGSTYFVYDRDKVTLAACCRLRTTLSDPYVLMHPESVRFCGFQNVTVNLPQAAYRAKRNGNGSLEDFIKEVDYAMDLAMQAHLQKKEFIGHLQKPGLPHWQMGKPTSDGKPYINLDEATYIIGLIGLNEAVQALKGKELHELSPEETETYALGTIVHMRLRSDEFSKKYGLTVKLEESPAESAARRFAKIDLERYPESRNYIKGDIDGDKAYYTNSIHFRADAPVDLVTRIKYQSLFHPIIEAGAIVHGFVGEEEPSSEAISALVEKTYKNTQCAQFTVSPEFTLCKSCSSLHRGLLESCPKCGNEDRESLIHEARIVGYFSELNDWNPSKLGEGEDRHKGNYTIMGSKETINFKLPTLQPEQDSVTGYLLAKQNCAICDKFESILEREQNNIEKKYNQTLVVKKYYADKEDGLKKLLIGKVNPTSLPSVIFVSPDGNELGRIETEYNDGRAVGNSVMKEVKDILQKYYIK